MSIVRKRTGVRSRCRHAAVSVTRRETATPSLGPALLDFDNDTKEIAMGGLIYLVGLIVVIMFILSVVGLR